jgi:hypothetical protein
MNGRLFFPMFNLTRLPANYPIIVGKKQEHVLRMNWTFKRLVDNNNKKRIK